MIFIFVRYYANKDTQKKFNTELNKAIDRAYHKSTGQNDNNKVIKTE